MRGTQRREDKGEQSRKVSRSLVAKVDIDVSCSTRDERCFFGRVLEDEKKRGGR